ncbi:hypothetical protein B0H13DRAFT_2684923 [Mycena leptocephala]|nr:hypothetical protein B0H13DRAFT_2684923 [Mycena leptocephala]
MRSSFWALFFCVAPLIASNSTLSAHGDGAKTDISLHHLLGLEAGISELNDEEQEEEGNGNVGPHDGLQSCPGHWISTDYLELLGYLDSRSHPMGTHPSHPQWHAVNSCALTVPVPVRACMGAGKSRSPCQQWRHSSQPNHHRSLEADDAEAQD